MHARGARVAEITGGTLVTLHGSGHLPMGREPVKVNLLLRDFVQQVTGTLPAGRAVAAGDEPPAARALPVLTDRSGPRAARPGDRARAARAAAGPRRVDWLTQSPVTDFLEAHGEHVHPASRLLASESGHFQSQAGEHDLHAFQAVRSMDEILVANFMVFQDLVTDEQFDLWIGDEAWDVDHFLHENPELKRQPVRLADRLRRLAADAGRRARPRPR